MNRRMIFLVALLLLFLASPAMAGSFTVEWTVSAWLDEDGNPDPTNTDPIRYEVGIGTESRVYTTIEPSMDLRHKFEDLDCATMFLAVRACPAATTDPADCSPWSYEIAGLPVVSHNAYCVPAEPPPTIFPTVPAIIVRVDIE